MRIDEAIAACEAFNPALDLIATNKLQTCHHSDGTLSRVEVFCISVIPASSEEAVRRYESPVGFETCVGMLIQAEQTSLPN